MKTALFSGIAAALLCAAGAVCWSASRVEDGMAATQRDLARLAYADSIKKNGEVQSRLGLTRIVPMTAGAFDGLREGRATAEYWTANYPMLAPPRDSEGALLERDGAVLFLAANAAFRLAQASPERQDRQMALRQLDVVLKAYIDVLKADPDHADAAYNYEYVARLRDIAARPALQARSRPEAPLGPPTIHGHPGAFPVGTDMSQFKVVTPKQGEEKPQGEERKEAPGATTGKEKVRKG